MLDASPVDQHAQDVASLFASVDALSFRRWPWADHEIAAEVAGGGSGGALGSRADRLGPRRGEDQKDVPGPALSCSMDAALASSLMSTGADLDVVCRFVSLPDGPDGSIVRGCLGSLPMWVREGTWRKGGALLLGFSWVTNGHAGVLDKDAVDEKLRDAHQEIGAAINPAWVRDALPQRLATWFDEISIIDVNPFNGLGFSRRASLGLTSVASSETALDGWADSGEPLGIDREQDREQVDAGFCVSERFGPLKGRSSGVLLMLQHRGGVDGDGVCSG